MKNKMVTRVDHCSNFIATGDATQNKEIALGHNTWWNFIVGQYFNIILNIDPSDGYRLFMQSVQVIHITAYFFITGGRIIGASTTICGFNKYDEEGEP